MLILVTLRFFAAYVFDYVVFAVVVAAAAVVAFLGLGVGLGVAPPSSCS